MQERNQQKYGLYAYMLIRVPMPETIIHKVPVSYPRALNGHV
jgi:hypothetical protein